MLFIVLGIVFIALGIIVCIFAVMSIIGLANEWNGWFVNYGWRVGLNAKNVFSFIIGLMLVAGGIAILILKVNNFLV